MMNRLNDEKNPYLLMHADNPVSWYPWGDKAFERAEEEQKPVFLSIGYSTCHWCHVMERESFRDNEVADLLNKGFISIKVDREERPDIDSFYMRVCFLFTGNGGWPLTIIMTPDKQPFFASTYIPRTSQYGVFGMLQILPKIIDLWEHNRSVLYDLAGKNISVLEKERERPMRESKEDSVLFNRTFQYLAETYDPLYGGFGKAPKFPNPSSLYFLLRYWKKTGSEKALSMCRETCTHMASGGIYDHIGYGFHRYSTTRDWNLPHFEKMLYDQALLGIVYIEVFQATGDGFYKQVAEEILDYCERELVSPEGGFYTAEDADSEGVEGKYYLWNRDELKSLLSPDDFTLFSRLYLEENEENTRGTGAADYGDTKDNNIIHKSLDIERVALSLGLSPAELGFRSKKILETLASARKKRKQPFKDRKILTDWNGLLIAALAKAGSVFDDPHYVELAERAAQFILSNLVREEWILLHRYIESEAGVRGLASDYAFFIRALLELYEATFRAFYLKKALVFQNYFLDRYWDTENGGFFISDHTQSDVVVREKEYADLPIPSANSVGLLNLIRLYRITGNEKYAGYGEQLVGIMAALAEKAAGGYAFSMGTLLVSRDPFYEIIITGERNSGETGEILSALKHHFLPNSIILFKDVRAPDPVLEEIAPYCHDYRQVDGKTTIYMCKNHTCQAPVTSVKEMLKIIS